MDTYDVVDVSLVSDLIYWLTDLPFLNQQHKICPWLYFQTFDLWKTFFYIPTASRETFAQGKINVKTYMMHVKSQDCNIPTSYQLYTEQNKKVNNIKANSIHY